VLAHNELKTAIYGKLTSASSFNTNIGGRVYYLQAPHSTAYPYCVFSFFSDLYSFDSGKKWEEIFIQFSIYDNSSSNIGTLESNLIDLLRDAALTFTNFTQIDLQRTAKRYLLYTDIFNTILEYRIEIEHT